MPCVPVHDESASQLELELYFLIAKFLESGPCKKAADALKQELEASKRLPKRIDWEGNEHFRSFENLLTVNNHIAPNHLLQICQRIGPLLEREVPSSVKGVMSLLGAGKQSILRTSNDTSIKWTSSTFVALRHGRPLPPPITLANQAYTTASILAREQTGEARSDHAFPQSLYSKISLLTKSLGHLSSVYCVMFDRTGEYIFTGADDNLVKIWSVITGRLLVTIRGHASEITDITISYDNRFVAAGSCDKCVRVWCTTTTAPIAVLQSHTGMITSVQFCPLEKGNTRYLMSTGADSCVCFWPWNISTRKFESKPIKFIERSRAGARMLCSSFSPGGVFLSTGSSDHVIRTFCFTTHVPEKICELEAHGDTVDCIQYCNQGSRFVSGSKDGTARIWHYERQEWRAIVLNMAHAQPDVTASGSSQDKVYVTMVGWTQDDQYVVVAVSDLTLKVCSSYTGQLVHVLKGHTDEVYVLENNPVDSNVFLSAGHDGNIILWDLTSGKSSMCHYNAIPGQGHGAVFDCKWAPDGQSFAATDAHGYLMYFGFGSSERYKRLPEEQYFHTDYRPLIRDCSNYVLDEQTQQAPHLMPPPFLVDIDGNPQPPQYQRLVPGREHLTDQQLVPQIVIAPNGSPEVLDEEVPEVPTPEAEIANRDIIDHMIERMQQAQDARLAVERGVPSQPSAGGAASTSPRGNRRSSESRRQSDIYVTEDLTGGSTCAAGNSGCRHRIVRPLQAYLHRQDLKRRQQMADEELKMFKSERNRKPLSIENDSSDSYMRKRHQGQGLHDPNAAQYEETGRNRLTTRALYDTEEEEAEEEEEEDEQLLWNDDDDLDGNDNVYVSESSEYSDWTADAGMNLQPPKRTSQRQPVKKKRSSSEEEPDISDDEETTKSRKKKRPPAKKKKETRRQRNQRKMLDQQEEIRELPDEFRPPEWLTDTIPRKAPYVPQLGDEVMYFRQGHELYVQAVETRNVYPINPAKNQPWHKTPSLREQELVKIIGIKYEILPPRLVCLKLAYLATESDKLTGGSFTIKYHDMADVIDFLVLRQNYDIAIRQNFKEGDRFHCIIDDAWWAGTIVTQSPYQREYPDSLFQCFQVQWDNGEIEFMSPWDLEPMNNHRLPRDDGESMPVTTDELKRLMYRPKSSEWPPGGRDVACDRISCGMERIMELSIAEPFLAPVDLNAFPFYAMVIEYPIDLSTIKARLENRYYRRVTSIQYDVRYLETNTHTFNEPGSQIVKYTKLVTELILRFISDVNCTDPMLIYNELTRDVDYAIKHSTDAAEENDVDSRVGGSSMAQDGSRRTRRSLSVDSWRDLTAKLLQTIMESDDSEPFRSPVDLAAYPDYLDVINGVPMDLSEVEEKLQSDVYRTPVEFCKDVRLVFNNSKKYNTKKKSRISAMTLRLSAMFEEQIRDVFAKWKTAKKYRKSGKTRRLPAATKDQSPVSTPLDEPSTSGYQDNVERRPHRSTRSHAVHDGSTQGSQLRNGSLRNGVKRHHWEVTVGEDNSATDDESEEKEQSDYEVRRRIRSSPKKKTLVKKSSSRSREHESSRSNLYSTRCATGSMKRRRYNEQQLSSNNGSSNSDTEEDIRTLPARTLPPRTLPSRTLPPPVNTNNHINNDASSSSDTSSDSDATDIDVAPTRSMRHSTRTADANHRTVTDRHPASRTYQGSDSNNSDDDDDDGRVVMTRNRGRRTHRPGTDRHGASRTFPASDSNNSDDDDDDGQAVTTRNRGRRTHRTVTDRHGASRTFHGSDSDSDDDDDRAVTTRNRGRRTVRYREDSEHDADRASVASDNDGTPTANVSSRGRVRRMTPRAQAAMLAE